MSKKTNVLVVLLGLSIVVYLPIITKGLASDDFGVMHRIVFGNIFYLDGFFRPLSDISLYVCYLIAGFDGWIYNLFNIVLHGASAYLLYRTCLLLFKENEQAAVISRTAAVFFVLYPFHNESIVWVVGRASNLSCFLGFSALYSALAYRLSVPRMLLIGLLYFASLSTYETTITLPFIAAVFLWQLYPTDKRWIKGLCLFGGVAVLNLLVRSLLVKEIVGEYGARMFDPSVLNNLVKYLKTAGRLFLPPMASASAMTVLAVFVFAVLGGISIRLWKKTSVNRLQLLGISLAVLFSAAIPFLFGVSTRTIEGDRLLYFPSYFLCCWISFVLITWMGKPGYRWINIAIASYFLVFLQINNFTWRKADRITKTILADMAALRPQYKKLLVHRLPEEYKGAHVFRNGFMEALLLNGIDTTGIQIATFMDPMDIHQQDQVFLPEENRPGWVSTPEMPVIYWNNRNMVIFR
ncbi:hypothetical protein [Flavihumibacter sp. CACIAM 22H1]|uniref:hypothetical protein n=1 Tax=Flavihumibacter sp. CACIAM 22H1 TaxID=1812911 RepID=UPI0007A8259D|nr:hypothetical protein [Flavihumibacter sp. CACIAM 22H1]KYP13997.1 MAG: hypothetical protein A1D16_16375 [Flavihumibacter sp. CACIAM 22H1]